MINKIFYKIGILILRILFFFYLNFKYKFKTKIPKGPKIYAVNHPTEYDAFPALILAPDFVHTMINEEIWELLFPNIIFNLTSQIKIIRGADSHKTIFKCLEILDKSEAILIAPEGEKIVKQGKVRAKKGVIRLALEKKVPIIPMAVWLDNKDIIIRNIYYKKLKKMGYLHSPKFRANYGCVFGEPIYLDEYYEKKLSMDNYQELANMVMRKIYNLSKEAKSLF
ncbi:1-acyl-sn-glycerol-3-phosphate acyltransferase [bacterium]|nr:1-acyl-sn-glycerol-3-phosphate acyltransferase [bacterium]